MAVTQYTVIEGDRWDMIAYAAYGDASRMKDLIEANKGVPIYGTLPAGLQINVPILQTPSKDVQNELLPPWKRQ